MKKEYLNKKDVYKMTGISIATLNRWIHEKKHIPLLKQVNESCTTQMI